MTCHSSARYRMTADMHNHHDLQSDSKKETKWTRLIKKVHLIHSLFWHMYYIIMCVCITHNVESTYYVLYIIK